MKSVFAYPGGKTYLAQWIIDHFPDHHCYVEVFGGSASVLISKDPSPVEVYNDLDGDITQFFEVLRNRPDELIEWFDRVPYSKNLHEKWAGQFYDGYRPEDPIERAGRFFYLRYTQFASKYKTKSGFSSAAKRSQAIKFRNGVEDLEEFAERFHPVQIENRDYAEIVDRFDEPDTLFYCDPPYVDVGDALYTHEGAFDHDRFVETLRGIEGKWVVSYEDLPPGLEDFHVVERDRAQYMSTVHEDADKRSIERLVMNYNPDTTPSFAGADQSNLEAFGD